MPLCNVRRPILRPGRAGAFTAFITAASACTPRTSFPRPAIPLQISAFSIKSEPGSGWSIDSTPELWRPKSFDSAHAVIQHELQKYNLRDWGFVIVRCTYRSQKKWDKFIALAQGHARDYFETSRRFEDWALRPGGPGVQERQGTKFPPGWRSSLPLRYNFFLHVDEESLESVMEGPKKGPEGQEGNEWDIVPAEDRDSEVGLVAEEDLHELRKRVRIDRLISMYAMLEEDTECWYDLPRDDEDIIEAWTW